MASYSGRDSSLPTRLDFWVERIGTLPILSIDADIVDREMGFLAQRGAMRSVRGKGIVNAGRPLAPATLNRYLVALGSVLSYARRRRLLPRTWVSPLRGVEKQPEDNARTIYLSAEQVERVVAVARTARWKKLPALILLAFITGLRAGALQQLRWKDVDLDARRLTVERTKNGRPMVAHMTERVAQELRSMPGIRHPEALVFSGYDEHRVHDWRKSWHTVCREAGVGHIPFHALRHSCASHLASKGASAVQLADVLGHRTLRMVQRYSHLNVNARAEFIDRAFT
jgi:integrase